MVNHASSSWPQEVEIWDVALSSLLRTYCLGKLYNIPTFPLGGALQLIAIFSVASSIA